MHAEKEERQSKMFSDQYLFYCILVFYFLLIPFNTISLLYYATPYGKHYHPGWGLSIPAPLAWFIMESPTLWGTLLLFPLGQHHSNPTAQILISPFLFHYFHRTIIYPLRLFIKSRPPNTALDSPAKPSNSFPLSIAIWGLVFNFLNAYLQTRWISHYADYEGDEWFWWRFAGGMAVFVSGMAVNMKSDYALMALKTKGGTGYKIPRGGWFELVSCPNYFGEMVEWLGWALMTWSWAGFGFFFYTCSVLVPRARQNHKWYLKKFVEDYPRKRKIVIPFVY